MEIKLLRKYLPQVILHLVTKQAARVTIFKVYFPDYSMRYLETQLHMARNEISRESRFSIKRNINFLVVRPVSYRAVKADIELTYELFEQHLKTMLPNAVAEEVKTAADGTKAVLKFSELAALDEQKLSAIFTLIQTNVIAGFSVEGTTKNGFLEKFPVYSKLLVITESPGGIRVY